MRNVVLVERNVDRSQKSDAERKPEAAFSFALFEEEEGKYRQNNEAHSDDLQGPHSISEYEIDGDKEWYGREMHEPESAAIQFEIAIVASCISTIATNVRRPNVGNDAGEKTRSWNKKPAAHMKSAEKTE